MPKPLFLYYNIACVHSTFERGLPRKRVQKRRRRLSSMKEMPPRPLIKKTGKIGFADFRVLNFRPIFHLSVWFLVFSEELFSRFFGTLNGWPKTGKKQGFWLSRDCLFCPFGPLMVTFRLHIPCCLQMCEGQYGKGLSHRYPDVLRVRVWVLS